MRAVHDPPNKAPQNDGGNKNDNESDQNKMVIQKIILKL